MHDESKQFQDGDPATESIIVLQLLRQDRPEWWSRADVLHELDDIDQDAILGSLGHLGRLGLVVLEGERVRASDGLRHIDSLGLICI
jgi:hypothetical protein